MENVFIFIEILTSLNLSVFELFTCARITKHYCFYHCKLVFTLRTMYEQTLGA